MNGQCQPENLEAISAIAGLGNPGKEYENTRHNAGFRVVERIAAGCGVALQVRKFKANWGNGAVEGRKILLIQPLTYMNRSGEAVGELLRYFGVRAEELLVIHDDLDLSCGKLKLARGGGAGGHKGVISIIQHLGTGDFARLKLGIGKPAHGEPVESFVLDPAYPEEREESHATIALAEEAARFAVASGLSEAMNRYNRRKP